MAVLEEVAIRVPALTPFVAKYFGDQPKDVFVQMDIGGRRNMPSNTGVHQGDALGPVLFCMPVGTILRKFRARFKPKQAEATAYVDGITISDLGMNPDTVQVVTILKEQLSKLSVTLNETKTVALASMDHTPITRVKACWRKFDSPPRRKGELSS